MLQKKIFFPGVLLLLGMLFNQTTYTHVGAMGNTLIGYYQMASKSSILCQTNYVAPSANRISNFQIFTGLDNNLGSIQIQLFPNPANNLLNISSNLFTEQNVELEIKNVLGQTIKRVNGTNRNKQVLDISHYKSGT